MTEMDFTPLKINTAWCQKGAFPDKNGVYRVRLGKHDPELFADYKNSKWSHGCFTIKELQDLTEKLGDLAYKDKGVKCFEWVNHYSQEVQRDTNKDQP